jgi:hypothetical protein
LSFVIDKKNTLREGEDEVIKKKTLMEIDDDSASLQKQKKKS